MEYMELTKNGINVTNIKKILSELQIAEPSKYLIARRISHFKKKYLIANVCREGQKKLKSLTLLNYTSSS